MWKSLQINKNMIDQETAKAVLVKMPSKSKYAGFKFWHPKKLVHDGVNRAAKSLPYKDDWVFKLTRTSDKTFKVLAAVEISANEMAKAMSALEIAAPLDKNEPRFETIEPKKIKPEQNEVDECLKVND